MGTFDPSQSQLLRWLHELGHASGLFRVVAGRPSERGAHAPGGPGTEVTLELTGRRQQLHLVVELKQSVHPKQVIATLAPLAAQARAASQNTLVVLAAGYVSPRVAQVCKDHRVGYLDGAGNCHLVGPGLFLHVEGRPNLRPDTRPAERLFAPKSSRITRVLLEHPERAWRVQALASEARVSMGLASRIKQKLVEEAYVQDTPAGIRVEQPDRLLGDWAAAYKLPKLRVPVYSLDEPERCAQQVVRWGDKHNITCALAEFSAAARLAPMVRSKRAAVYVAASLGSPRLDELMNSLALKQVESGPTAELWLTQDDSVFQSAQMIEDTRVVSALQAYLDVRKNPARGQEAANELYERILKPRFTRAGGGA